MSDTKSPDTGGGIMSLFAVLFIVVALPLLVERWDKYERQQEVKIQQLREQVSQLQKLVLSHP